MSAAAPLYHSITGVLAATDLQHGSGAILDLAAGVARATGASLHAAYVLTPDAVERSVRARDPDAADDVLEEARRGLWLQMGHVRPDGVDLESAVVVRRRVVHEGVLDVARASGVDLIVMGSHAHSPSSSRLGSTADRVVRTAPVPCLVVRGEPVMPIRRAAVLTDFSEDSRHGLAVALSWLPALGLDAPDAHLDVIHYTWPQTDAGAPDWVRRKLESEIADVSLGLSTVPRSVRPRIVFSCYPAAATVDAIASEGYQLVVVATHGHNALSRALIGSVTLGLLHTATCPVLVVPRARRAR